MGIVQDKINEQQLNNSEPIIETDINGNVTRMVDASGNETLRTYDNSNRLTQEIAGGITQNFTYNNEGRISKITNSNGLVVDMVYDKSGSISHYKDNQGTEWWCDEDGKLELRNGKYYLNGIELQ